MADQNNFGKFRRRARRDRCIKSGIVGASAAALAVGGILLASKWFGFPTAYSAAGLVALPLGVLVAVLLLRMSDRRLARRMDDELSLNERVQTMLTFADSDECIPQLQRADTEARLAAIPTKQLAFSGLWLYILLPVLTAALLVGAILVPARAENRPTPAPDGGETETQSPPREITDWEWKALDELIAYVQASGADAEIMKPRTVTALENLRTLLQNGVSEESFPSIVGVTVTEINNSEVDANASPELSDRQKEINSELARYTVTKLYEIFGLIQKEEPNDPEQGEEDEKNPNQSWNGTGDVVMGADEKLFDADQGYVSYPDVINAYYGEINKAFREGALSEEEWYEFIMTYFKYLYGTEQE